jgi:hypothetical protein
MNNYAFTSLITAAWLDQRENAIPTVLYKLSR